MGIKAFRRGLTAHYWSSDPSNVVLKSSSSRKGWALLAPQNISFSFVMPSKGGGDTQVRLEITPDSFLNVMKEMLAADEGATRRAMGEVLRESKNITVKLCGEIILDQSKDEPAAALPPAKAAPTVVSWVKAVA
jgi:hypothetical protein